MCLSFVPSPAWVWSACLDATPLVQHLAVARVGFWVSDLLQETVLRVIEWEGVEWSGGEGWNFNFSLLSCRFGSVN